MRTLLIALAGLALGVGCENATAEQMRACAQLCGGERASSFTQAFYRRDQGPGCHGEEQVPAQCLCVDQRSDGGARKW